MSFVAFDDVGVCAPDGRAILDRFALDVAEGEVMALIGSSGSGKTTALKLVNALRLPSTGEVRVAGRPTTACDPIRLRRGIGYVIQEGGLFPHLTVVQNVEIGPTLAGFDTPRVATCVADMLALVALPISEYGGRYPHELSGGQRQRVGVARALAAHPPLVLLDEPFGALDPITRHALQGEFRALQQRLGTTAIFVTHDLREALRVADRIAVVDRGRIALCLAPPQVRTTTHPIVQALKDASGL